MDLHLDFETASGVDLINEGVYNYAMHPSTHILTMSWAWGDDDPEAVDNWQPTSDFNDNKKPFPKDVLDFILNGKGLIRAHNAAFERLIIWYVLWHYLGLAPGRRPPIERFYCTSAQARIRGLPGALGDLSRALVAGDKGKLTRGRELIKALCIPINNVTGHEQELDHYDFNRDPELLQEMYEYCDRDVISERFGESAMPRLTERELAVYHRAEHINDRGLMIDFDLAEAASAYAIEEKEAICVEIAKATDDACKKSQGATIRQWIFDRLPEDQMESLKYYKDGEEKWRLDRFNREMLMRVDDNEATLDPVVREVIELMHEVSRSSVGKFKAMMNRASITEDRVEGAYMTFGAGQTGRFSSKGLQVHNFTRKTPKTELDYQELREDIIKHHEFEKGTLMQELASMCRPAIITPKGKTFVCGDWSSVEAVALPWICNYKPRVDAWKKIFADETGTVPDLYQVAASKIYRKPVEDVTDAERQIGKVGELSLGYMGGAGAYLAMARNYGLVMTEPEVKPVVDTWREDNRWVRKAGYAMTSAAMSAFGRPGHLVQAKGTKINFFVVEEGPKHLFMILPSNRVLTYPYVRMGLDRFGNVCLDAMKGSWKPKADKVIAHPEDWPHINLWPGLLLENATQATCADILFDAMERLDDWGWLEALVGHTHDELLLEVDEDEVEDALITLDCAMKRKNDWMKGFPINASFWQGKWYRK